MTTCPSCGKELPPGDFPFCPFCTAPLAAAPAAREQRKTVTVVFCDVTGSTSLGESTDPEALRALLARYFERMKAIVEAHGGTVEKFIGDAVMAVFGVPQVHEDDALRAARAALEMRAALPELGLEARIGLNTGEVVTSTEERLATGDAVNVAARLEQAARPGEILIGGETLALVRDAVETEAVEPLDLKGKAERMPAWRLLAVTDGTAPVHAAPMVGREMEVRRLHDAFEQTVRGSSSQLFTVLGSAGVGKSRLAAELIQGLSVARVVRGRCLSYGEGITYWPVVEVVKQLQAFPSDEAAAAAIRSLLGENELASSAEEIAWAFRKLLEEQARERPLVIVFDDLHWGEETFLELIEHVADVSRGAPLLLLCMSRPELLDRRPGWGGGKLNATTVLLEALDSAETDVLLETLGANLDDDLRERIREASEGNPLFVEEMLALVRESGGGEVAVPPTIQALLAARLDQLDPAERMVLERGSVEGRIFHESAVRALSEDEARVPARLLSLVRKELVRPDGSRRPGDEVYRFRHLLIRDAAYDALPKAIRAELHERFAAWLEERAEDLAELDEILGHHLEQAARYKRELGQEDAVLAERAGERLGAAGERALWRADHGAAIALLERALELLRPLRSDVRLELSLAGAYGARFDSGRAAEIAEAAAERARIAGDERGEAVARMVAAHARFLVAVEPDVGEVERLAHAALPLLEEADDHAGLVHVWMALRDLAILRGRGERAHASEQVLRNARLAGAQPTQLFGLDGALVGGPRPADEALRTLDAVMPDPPAPGPLLQRARLLAMLGRFEEAWSLGSAASERLREQSGDDRGGLIMAELAELAGDYETAARYYRDRCAFFEERELWSYLSTYAPALGRCLCELGRYDEAEPLAQRGRELGVEEDVATQMLWRQVQARVLARRGRHGEAQQLAREAVAIAAGTEALNLQGQTLVDLAEVLADAGRTDEAAASLEQALELYERKKNLAMVAQVKPRLEALRGTDLTRQGNAVETNGDA